MLLHVSGRTDTLTNPLSCWGRGLRFYHGNLIVCCLFYWEVGGNILVQFAAQNEAAETKAPVKFYMCLCLKQLFSASLVITHYGCLLLSEKEMI